MLTLTIDDMECYNEETSEFLTINARIIELEHSLISLSKWESKWCKPFLGKKPKTNEEIEDYVRCMIITKNVPDEVCKNLSNTQMDKINAYIDQKMTATTFSDINKQSRGHEIITAEIIYYWMVTLNIPFECQKWHLNRLLTLIRVCSIKNTSEKMSKSAVLKQNKALNAARKKQYNTRG